ncbi:hypothetical protein NEIG_02203 [Nematocida sp. ERTm5]|nr:hypothetical protein NEIG_02203 [Nematocida sp. ERTm5]
MEEKQVMLQKLLKVTYLSVQKFGNSLNETSPDKISEKITKLLEYLQKKEEECQKIEEEKKTEEQIEKEKIKNEMVIEMASFLGKRGFINTAQAIKEKYPIKALVDIQPYKEAKESVKNALAIKYYKKSGKLHNIPIVDTPNNSVRMTVLCREVIRLCEAKTNNKKEVCKFIKKHRENLPKKILSLVVLPSASTLFARIAEEYKECTISAPLLMSLVYKNKSTNNYFYQRVALGISGFITPVCREKEKADCPGCTKSIAKLAEHCPKSTRSSSRLLCSTFRTVIPSNHATYVSKKGDVFSEYATRTEKLKTILKKCYFV